MSQSYRYEVHDRPAYSTLALYLEANQAVRATAGRMVSMSAHVNLDVQVQGGVMGALKRVVTHESIFQSIFTAVGAPGELLLAPPMPGDIVPLELRNSTWFVQGSCYLAGDPALNLDAKFGGVKGFFSGTGLFLIYLAGTGTVFASAYGSVLKKSLAPGEKYVINNGHVVAFEGSVQYQLRKAAQGGWLKSFASGEGIVVEFTGPGEVYLQTRNIESLADILKPFFPSGSGGGIHFDT